MNEPCVSANGMLSEAPAGGLPTRLSGMLHTSVPFAPGVAVPVTWLGALAGPAENAYRPAAPAPLLLACATYCVPLYVHVTSHKADGRLAGGGGAARLRSVRVTLRVLASGEANTPLTMSR